jgi:hypothetical protein
MASIATKTVAEGVKKALVVTTSWQVGAYFPGQDIVRPFTPSNGVVRYRVGMLLNIETTSVSNFYIFLGLCNWTTPPYGASNTGRAQGILIGNSWTFNNSGSPNYYYSYSPSGSTVTAVNRVSGSTNSSTAVALAGAIVSSGSPYKRSILIADIMNNGATSYLYMVPTASDQTDYTMEYFMNAMESVDGSCPLVTPVKATLGSTAGATTLPLNALNIYINSYYSSQVFSIYGMAVYKFWE